MFTLEELKTKVIELGRRYPNAVYQRVVFENGRMGCSYHKGVLKDGPVTQGCIFGHAFRELGAEICYTEGAINYVLYKLGFNTKLIDKYRFVGVQVSQDDGYPWGEAIECLEE